MTPPRSLNFSIRSVAAALLSLFAFSVFAIPTDSEKPAQREVVTVSRDGSNYSAGAPDNRILSQGSDAATVINAAIAAVSGMGGGTVLLDAGTYELSAPILGRTGVRLVGAGGLVPDEQPADNYPTVIQPANAGLPALVEFIGADGARLEHLVVDGAGKVDCGLKTASYAVRVRDCVFRGGMARCVWVTAEESKSHDMYVQATFMNCLFDEQFRGIGIEESVDTTMGRRPPPGGSIHTGAFTDGVICGCRFVQVGDIGAEITGGWQFFENTVDGKGREGAVVVNGGATTVTDNDIRTTEGPALLIALGNVAITGNQLVRRDKGSVIKVLSNIPAVTIARNDWHAEPGGIFVEFDPASSRFQDAIFENSGKGGPVCNITPTTDGLYCRDNTTANLPWKPQPLVEAWQGTAIGAVVSTDDKGNYIARSCAGRQIASSSDAGAVINAAVASVGNEAAAVFITRGTYSVAAPIRLKPGVVLVGEGGMSRVPVGYEAMGTILQAGSSNMPAVVDMTDAAGSRLDELAVDGSGSADACVKMAGRAETVDNCFLERAAQFGLEMANGNDSSPGSYSGMVAANILVHAGGDPVCLAVINDPNAHGPAPANGTVIDARLRLGFVQAVIAGGPGWTFLGNHGTSNGHSKAGVELDADDVSATGNYFDTAHGPRLILAGHRLEVIGNHFQATPTGEFPTILLAASGADIQISANTWHPPRQKADSDQAYFTRFDSGDPSGVRVIGNAGEGAGQITNLSGPAQSAVAAGNFFTPDKGGYARLDAGK